MRAPQNYSGRSFLNHARDRGAGVHPENQEFGWELNGNRAIRQGRWKLSWQSPLEGRASWQRFDLHADPGEAHDLAEEMPRLKKRLERL